jgi:hypothetical protein
MDKDISPRESLERVLRYWWVIALVMMAGGLIGWVIGHFSSPVYEARAGYRVTLDDDAVLTELHKTKPDAELTYDIRAPYLAPVALVFYTPQVRAAVQEQAIAAGLDFPKDGFRTGDLFLDQHGNEWTAIVRHKDPDTAAQLANLWITNADTQLNKAHEQAVLAASLKLKIDVIAKCFNNAGLSEANQCGATSFASLDDMQTSYDDLDHQYQDALTASDGISTMVNFQPGTRATPPARPIYYNTGSLMLIGSLIGLIIGGVIVQRLDLKTG